MPGVYDFQDIILFFISPGNKYSAFWLKDGSLDVNNFCMGMGSTVVWVVTSHIQTLRIFPFPNLGSLLTCAILGPSCPAIGFFLGESTLFACTLFTHNLLWFLSPLNYLLIIHLLSLPSVYISSFFSLSLRVLNSFFFFFSPSHFSCFSGGRRDTQIWLTCHVFA